MSSGIWALLLFALALLFFCLEFFIPSSGALGLLATSSLVGSIWMVFQEFGLSGGTAYVLGLSVFIPVLIASALRWWPYTPIGRRLLNLPPVEERDEPVDPSYESLRRLVGEYGVARSLMLPAGVVEIHGHRYDAVAELGGIDKGEPIQVVRTEGLHMVVRKAQHVSDGENSENTPLEDPFA
jgi:membrane-bound ClpP family serine protease